MLTGKRVEVKANNEEYVGIVVGTGIDFIELRDGIGHYSVLIIELDDGSLKTTYPCYVKVLKL
jgi:hypothetical protein